MSRLRRLLVSGRIFFITTHFAKPALPVESPERDVVIQSLAETRKRRKLLLFAYCAMPTHVHLLFAPAVDDSMSDILRELKLRAAKRVLLQRKSQGRFWQARSFDRIIRHRKEWSETVEYIHWNPVRDGLVATPQQWRWSSWFGWHPGGDPLVPVDVVEMPVNEKTPIGW